MHKKSRLCSLLCDPAGTRTQGPIIKSDVLYQLSYEINLCRFRCFICNGVQKYSSDSFAPKKKQNN